MKENQKSWFRRHWILSIFLGLIVLGIIGSLFRGDSEQTDLTGKVIDEGIQNASEVENQEQQDQTQGETHSSSQPEDNQTNNQQTEAPLHCIDSDGGKDYYTKGHIDHGDGTREYDKCDTWNPGYEKHVIEYYCTSDGSGQTNYGCPYGCFDGRCNSEPQESDYFTVTRVIDGDTIEINTGEKVRLICIDTPETYEPGYQEAKNYLTNLILNKEVYLEKDVSETDRYGRLLRYIYTEEDCTDLADCFVNLMIVLNGYGEAYPYNPDTTLCPQIENAEEIARENYLGIWAEEETPPEDSGYICSYNAYNCGDFSTHAQAQAVFEACGGINNDIHRLDRDNDGLACESLP